jgi:protein-S-isoprenylcysteine O-methyltransferase Ste14
VRKTILMVAVLAAAAVFAVTDSAYPPGSVARHAVRWLGHGLILISILGRTWSSLYIGGRKTSELVTDGPYSVVRNPLYAFSILGAAGIGAQGGSLSFALAGACVGFLVFRMVAQQEEGLLLARHGPSYESYLKRVPRFMPNPRLWHDEETRTIQHSRVVATFADALLFLLAIPLAMACEYLHMARLLPILASLP